MISLSQARKLCTGRELELVEASRKSSIVEMTPARLRQKVTRARTLRDKYRGLAKGQRRQARGKAEPRGARAAQGNENTVRKAELFDEVLGRFEAGLARAEGKRAPAKKGGKRAEKQAANRAKRADRRTTKAETRAATKRAQPASPRKPGAAAPKGARQRTS